MNPIKILIILLTISIVLSIWSKVIIDSKDDITKSKSIILQTISLIIPVSLLILCAVLSVYIPYSVYWLMSIWNW